MAIVGTHALLYRSQSEEVRAILRDLPGLGHGDAGGGWLIMKPEDHGYGLVTYLALAGDLKVQVSQPHHPVAAEL